MSNLTALDHERFMRAALTVAAEGMAEGELPIGAVVVLNGEIIAAAHTAERAQNRLLVHAELLALAAADRLQPFPGNRRDVTLYTTCEPCLMCMGAAMSFFLGTIAYAVEAPSDGATALVQGWQRNTADFPAYRAPQIIGGVLRAEAIALFQQYVTRHPAGSGPWAWAQSMAALA
jgi:tRNA(adenine34) deaminase